MNRANSAEGELVKVLCDGSYEFYHSCFLDVHSYIGGEINEKRRNDNEDGEPIDNDNAALTMSLQNIQWWVF